MLISKLQARKRSKWDLSEVALFTDFVLMIRGILTKILAAIEC